MKKVFFVIVSSAVLLLSICLGQSIANESRVNTARAKEAGADEIALYPEEELCTVLLPQKEEEAIEATADGAIPDLFIPGAGAESAAAPEESNPPLELKGSILIYHTHTLEAYRQEGEYTYREKGEYRTEENEKNMVRVGEELKSQLEALGYTVIHDTTNHEPPSLSTSYDRSLETVEKYRAKYPDIGLYIDVHRDAADESAKDDVTMIDGKRCARLMFVVGTGMRRNGTLYDEKPNWKANYALAESIQAQLKSVSSDFTRKIRVKDGRYNQHISEMSMLVEVGHNANTLEEALNSMPYLARAIDAAVGSKS